ncbi:MAG: hypothetical protein OEX18_12060 [Candidatus Krumholzibacteria bacterium]|nr:hypothetical protein [Candidatus Krumholzibacteria bacterium]MDH4337997.1 hypothetical protein [Candidatus Krumholzibacteria bacterium]MDH5270576.1 hypothetical protein [Candidatus Krumholzibacteria bacterium]
MKKQVAGTVALLVSALISGAAAVPKTVAPSIHKPVMLFDLSDEVMAGPLGVVADVAVGDSVVYVLDQQNCNVRRITLTGLELPALGREGEGPGDISGPSKLANASGGKCAVIQGISNRAPCFTPAGNLCDPYDISSLRRGYASVIWVRAEFGRADELILSGLGSRREVSDSFAQYEPVSFVTRLRADGSATELFSENPGGFETGAVRTSSGASFAVYGWDIAEDGTIIYADPSGEYRVFIGHPVDGVSQSIDLPEWNGDEDRYLSFVERAHIQSPNSTVLRVASVHWLGRGCFMVRPSAELSGVPAENGIGTFEVFRRNGDSLGRYTVYCDLDSANDTFFVRGNVLVVIRGAKSVARAAYPEVLGPGKNRKTPSLEVDEVRIRAYDLFSEVMAGR